MESVLHKYINNNNTYMGKKGFSFPIQRYKYLGEQMFDYFVNDGFLCMLHSHRTSVACVACRSRVAKIILDT